MKNCFISAIIAIMAAVAVQGQTVYSVKYKSEADVKVYVAKYKSEAEWKDKSKSYLMY